MNLLVKGKILLLGCFLLGFRALSQTCPVPPAGVQQGQFSLSPIISTTEKVVGWANGNNPLVLCPSTTQVIVQNTTVMAAGERAYYYYPFNPTNTPNPQMPTTGGTVYPINGASANQFRISVSTPGKYVIVQTTRVPPNGPVRTYACQVIEIPRLVLPDVEVTSCASGQVTVEIPNTDANRAFDNFEINWQVPTTTNIESFANNKTNSYFKKTKTYPNNSGYIISLKGSAVFGTKTCTQTATRSVTANGSGANAIPLPATGLGITNLTVLSETEIQLTTSPSRNYELLQSVDGGNNFQSLGDAFLGTKSLSVSNASRQQYCYKVRIKNACGTVSADSDMNCSIPIEAVPANKQNVINWKPIPGGKFTVQQISGLASPLPPPGFLGAAINTYTDNNTDCREYKYRIIASKPTPPFMTSRSMELSVLGKNDDKPNKVPSVFLTVNNANKVEIRPNYPPTSPNRPIKEVSLLRKNGTPYVIPTPNTTVALTDPNSEPDKKQECYKISYKNHCGVDSDPSDEFCAVFLKPTANGIEWTDYKTFPTGLLRYEIETKSGASFIPFKRLDATTFSYQPTPADLDPSIGEVRYRIKAVPNSGTASYSNETVFAPKATLFIPQAFTPNGDGINDSFDFNGYFIKEFQAKIYNRWGSVVFETDKYGKGNGWDGKIMNTNEKAPTGTYVYEYIVKDYKEQTEKKKGVLLLLQ